MKSYLYAVQDGNGREVVSAVVEVEKVSEVTAEITDDYHVALLHNGQQLGDATAITTGETYTLYRWPADDKLAEPVSHPVQ